jgi:hypothetical protein
VAGASVNLGPGDNVTARGGAFRWTRPTLVGYDATVVTPEQLDPRAGEPLTEDARAALERLAQRPAP